MSRSTGWTMRDRGSVPAASLLLLLIIVPVRARAGGGPFGIDYELHKGDTGVFSRNAQVGLEFGTVAFEAAGALVLGNHTELGHTFWQAADASVFAGLSAQVLKYAFSRARPREGDDPNAWFSGHGHQSFPSGEVALQASFVTPFIIDYSHDHPWVWMLEILPLWDAYARMKSQAHWQSDVIVGWALGTGFGYWATQRKVPLLVQILPDGVSVGFVERF
ncbi:MAG TPA: phosphatase PAP2 family protein [Steroidobacteraceae bacterium]|nr:phosphatase PAP2 family protein [Steroidobacteraceae bacterium]